MPACIALFYVYVILSECEKCSQVLSAASSSSLLERCVANHFKIHPKIEKKMKDEEKGWKKNCLITNGYLLTKKKKSKRKLASHLFNQTNKQNFSL